MPSPIKTPTPKTDAEYARLKAIGHNWSSEDVNAMCDFARQLETELDSANRTLEAYRKRARKLYTPDVAAGKIARDEEHMRNVDLQLEIATGVLRYFGLEVVNEISEGVLMLTTNEDAAGVKSCAYVRVIPGGHYAGDQSELGILREEFDLAQASQSSLAASQERVRELEEGLQRIADGARELSSMHGGSAFLMRRLLALDSVARALLKS